MDKTQLRTINHYGCETNRQTWINIFSFLAITWISLIDNAIAQGGPEDWPWYTGEEMDCQQIGDESLPVLNVPWGIDDRAFKTVPPQVEIRNSTIPASGLGAFATTFLKAHTWLGEYEGEIFVLEDYHYVTDYAWQSYRNDSMVYYIDGADMRTSNWLRWLNCPRTLAEENVRGLYCYGKVLYVTIKDVYPGQELFVYYGHDYAYRLGIDIDEMGGDLEEWMEYEKEYEEHQKKLQENNRHMEAGDDSQWVSWGDSQFEWKYIEPIHSEGQLNARREPAKNCKCACTLDDEKETEVKDNSDVSNAAKEHLRKEENREHKAESNNLNAHGTHHSDNVCDNTSDNSNSHCTSRTASKNGQGTETIKEETSDSYVPSGTQCEIDGDQDSNTCECDCFIKSETLENDRNMDSVTPDEHQDDGKSAIGE